jgi:hypothetical protein
MALGLRWLFRPEVAKHVRATYELRAFGNVVSAVVDRGRIDVSVGPADAPDLATEVLDRAVARAMSTEGMPASDAKMSEHVVLEGSEDALEDFLKSSPWILTAVIPSACTASASSLGVGSPPSTPPTSTDSRSSSRR